MLTYEECGSMLAVKPSHKLTYNTTLRKLNGDTFAVRFYNTDILLIHRDGSYTLNSGGFRTVTTKQRLNEFSPARVHQTKREWLVGNVEFTDGMRVSGNGDPA